MVEMIPAWKKPCCCESSGRKGQEISTRPGSTFSRTAPMWPMAPCRAKLPLVRRWKFGSGGEKDKVSAEGQKVNGTFRPPPSTLCLASQRSDVRQRKPVEVAGVRGGVGAGVLDEDEVAVLEVRREELLAHHDVHRVAGGARDVPRDGLAVATGIDVVAKALGGLDHAAEYARVPVHPALVVARGGAHDAADEVARVGDEVAPRLGDHLHLGTEVAKPLVDYVGDGLYGRDRLHVAHGIAAAEIQQARLEPHGAHPPEN